MRTARTAGWALLAATAAACGGASPTAPAPATPAAAQYFYFSGADGYWGFRVGANGSLSPVANGPLSATWPIFSAGVFLYCLSYVSGALMAGRVDANGTLTEITPALSAPGFVPVRGSVLIRRP